MSRERDSVEMVKLSLQAELARKHLTVATGHRLAYSLHAAAYNSKHDELAVTDPVTETYGYQTDLLIAEQQEAAAHQTAALEA